MSDQTMNETGDLQIPDELEMLKTRARVMGITFSNNIGIEALRKKIDDKLEGQNEVDAEPEATNPLQSKKATPANIRQLLLDENMKLVRLRITNMDPKKKDLPGEIFTVANGYIGTIRKFIPYGEVTEGGYHVPYCIYKQLDKRKFLNIRTSRSRNGEIKVDHSWAKEFALEVLPQLTPAELKRLALEQAAANRV